MKGTNAKQKPQGGGQRSEAGGQRPEAGSQKPENAPSPISPDRGSASRSAQPTHEVFTPPTTGRARHSVRAALPTERASKLETRNHVLGASGITAPTSPTPYILPKTILEKIWLARLHQKQLLHAGRTRFACDSPIVSHDRKLRVLTEELGEIAGAIDQMENYFPPRQPRAALSEPSTRALANLHDELTQIAAVAIAWLESLENPTPPDRGSASRSAPFANGVLNTQEPDRTAAKIIATPTPNSLPNATS